jgi:hypothetical protein
MTFVGLNSSQLSSLPAYKWYNEAPAAKVYPADLYTSQLVARIGALPSDDTRSAQATYASPGYACDGCRRCLRGVGNAMMPTCPANATCESLG